MLNKILVAFWVSLFLLSCNDTKSTQAPARAIEEPAIITKIEPEPDQPVEPEPEQVVELEPESFDRLCIDGVQYYVFQYAVVVGMESSGHIKRCLN